MYNVEEFVADRNLVLKLKDCVERPGGGGILNSVKIKITPRCNLKCQMCSYWRYPAQSEMPPERLSKLIDELAAMDIHKVHFSGGEPMLRPDIFKLIEKCSKLKIRANITSNGSLIDSEKAKTLVKSGVRSVSISLDGHNAKLHDGIRGVSGAFKKSVAAVERLATAREKHGGRKRMRIRINVVLQRANWIHLPEVVKLGGELGVDEVHPMPVDPKNPTHLLKKSEIKDFNLTVAPETESLRLKYRFSTNPLLVYPFGQTKDDVNKCREGLYARGFYEERLCYAPWMHTFIAWDGEVYPCCMTRGRTASLGNITDKKLKEVFEGEGYSQLRRSFVKSRLRDCARCDNFLNENRLLHQAVEKITGDCGC